jgi:hypothetical protein
LQDLRVETQLSHDQFQEAGAPDARLEETPVPLRGRRRERDAGQPRSRAHVDAGAVRDFGEHGKDPQGVLDMTLLEAGQVGPGYEIQPGGPGPHECRVERQPFLEELSLRDWLTRGGF